MSHFATPLIVINLGCEMVYVIEQRLMMQKIPINKSEKVLTEIVTVLLHPKLMEDLFLPQPVAPHPVIKQLISDISASSIMKLDEYSTNKLWDLITMIFKWQISVGTNQNIFDITRRHLSGIAALMPITFPKNIFKEAIDNFDTLINKLSDEDYKDLSNTIILWFTQYHSKISVLLRLGLQNRDGSIKLPAMINIKFLKNLGENIYKHDKKTYIDDYEVNSCDDNEINCLLAPIESVSPKNNYSSFKNAEIKGSFLNNIEISHVNVFNNDINFIPTVPRSTNEDLLEMLKNEA
ncbi:protein OSCP1 [Pieris rapae]|uniref:protein OSCP1 n=1 Tax=Pieris rapae TaxID=64459 RepID=UPI001E27F42C|nr:protein OSCP1 [Pieris rapae]